MNRRSTPGSSSSPASSPSSTARRWLCSDGRSSRNITTYVASDTSTVLKGAALLAAYALGLGAAFLLAGVAFARAMGAFRWLRDRYTLIQVVSGLILVALGLLLFFHRDWWLHVALNRALDAVGLTSP